MEDKRMNEIEEIEATEVDETQDSSNAGDRKSTRLNSSH